MTSDNILKNNSGVAKSFNTILDDTDLKIPERIKSILLALKNDTVFQQKNLSVVESKQVIKDLIVQKEILIQTKRNAILTILESNANGQERLNFIKSTNLEIDELNEQIIFFKQVETFLIQSLNQYENLFLKQAIDKYVQEQNILKERQKEQEAYNEYAIDIAKSVLDDIEDINIWLLKVNQSSKIDGPKPQSNREPQQVLKTKITPAVKKTKKQSSEKLKNLQSKVQQSQLQNKLKAKTEIPRPIVKASETKSKEIPVNGSKPEATANQTPAITQEKEQIKTESKPLSVILIQEPNLPKTNLNEDLEKKKLELEKEKESITKNNIEIENPSLSYIMNSLKTFFSEEWKLNTNFYSISNQYIKDKEEFRFKYADLNVTFFEKTNKFKLIYDFLYITKESEAYYTPSLGGVGSLVSFILHGNELVRQNTGADVSIFSFFKKQTRIQSEYSCDSFNSVSDATFYRHLTGKLQGLLKLMNKENILSSDGTMPDQSIHRGVELFDYDKEQGRYIDYYMAMNPAFVIYKLIYSEMSFFDLDQYLGATSVFNDFSLIKHFYPFSNPPKRMNKNQFLRYFINFCVEIFTIYKEDPFWKEKAMPAFPFIGLLNFSKVSLNNDKDLDSREIGFLKKIEELVEYTVVNLSDVESLGFTTNTFDALKNYYIPETEYSDSLSFENYYFTNTWLAREKAEKEYVNPISFALKFLDIADKLLLTDKQNKIEYESHLSEFVSFFEENFYNDDLLFHTTNYNIDINQEVNTQVYNEYIFNSLALTNQTINTLSITNDKTFLSNRIRDLKFVMQNEVVDLMTIFNLFVFENNLKDKLKERDLSKTDILDFLKDFKLSKNFFNLSKSLNKKNSVKVIFDGNLFYNKLNEIVEKSNDDFTELLLSKKDTNFISNKKYELTIDHKYGKINDQILDIFFVWRCLSVEPSFRNIENISKIEKTGLFENLFDFEKDIMDWNTAYSAMYFSRFGGFFDKIKQYDEQEVPIDGEEGNAQWSENFIKKGIDFDFLYLETGSQSFDEETKIEEMEKEIIVSKYDWSKIITYRLEEESAYDYYEPFVSYSYIQSKIYEDQFDFFTEPVGFLIDKNLPELDENLILDDTTILGWRENDNPDNEYYRVKYLYDNKYDLDSILTSSFGNIKYFEENHLYSFVDRRHSAFYKVDYLDNMFLYTYSYNLSQLINANKKGLKFIDLNKLLDSQKFTFQQLNGEYFTVNDLSSMFSYLDGYSESSTLSEDELLRQPKLFALMKDDPQSLTIKGAINYNFNGNQGLRLYICKYLEALSYAVCNAIPSKTSANINYIAEWYIYYTARFKLFFNEKIDWVYIFSVEDFGTRIKHQIHYLLWSILDCRYIFIENILPRPDYQLDFNLETQSKGQNCLCAIIVCFWEIIELIKKPKMNIFKSEAKRTNSIHFKIHTENDKKKIKSVMSFFDLSFKHSYLTKHTMMPFVFTSVLTNNFSYYLFINGLNLLASNPEGLDLFKNLKNKEDEIEEEKAILSFSDIGWCNFSVNQNNAKINNYLKSIYYNSYGNLFDKTSANIVFDYMLTPIVNLLRQGYLQFNIDPLIER